jgi:hypothetical protein
VVGDRCGEEMEVANGGSEVIDIVPGVDPAGETRSGKVVLNAEEE